MDKMNTKEKISKGAFSYYNNQKRRELIRTAVLFTLVAALLITGIVTTGDKKNWLTVIAILGVLPAARSAASAITRCMYRTADEALYQRLQAYDRCEKLLFNMVFTAKEKTVPVDVMAVSGNRICGYASRKGADTSFLEKHIRTILKGNKLNDLTIKIYTSEKQFLTWLDSHSGKTEQSDQEGDIRQVLLNISL